MLFKPVRRLTKRQIKEDKLVTMAAKTSAWLRLNYPKIIAGAAGLVILIIVANNILGKDEALGLEAADAFAKTKIAAIEGRIGDIFLHGEEAYTKYPGTGGGAQALLLVANTYFDLGRLSEGKGAFQRCIDDYSDDPVMVYAGWIGLAACLEQEGKPGAAAAKYEGFANTYRDSPFRGASLIEAARCYGEAGDRDKKRALLEMVIDGHKDSPLASDARVRLKTM